MDVPDSCFLLNKDWDPSYLGLLFNKDFFDFKELWQSNVNDAELVHESNKVERYSPITEDISLDDEVLCNAVEEIEHK